MRNALSNVSDIGGLDSERATGASNVLREPQRVKNPVPPGMKTLKCHISEDTYRKLKARAALDGDKIAQSVEALLLVGLKPAVPSPTIEQQLVRTLPHVDRHLFEKLDILRVTQGKAWQQYMSQGLTLLYRQLTGQPIALDRPSCSSSSAHSAPPAHRVNTAANANISRKVTPSGFWRTLT